MKADITELLASVRSRMMSIDEARALLLGDTMPSADASLLDRLHTAEAKVAILESKWNSVPWEDLYECILIASHTTPIPDSVMRVTSWHDLNEPKEAQP